MNDDDGAWFLPTRFGCGAGAPIRWQGWAVLAVYMATIVIAGFLIPYSWVAYGAVVIFATVALAVVAATRTRGGWRWRWGDED